MSPAGLLRAPPFRVTFDGQSLNNYPVAPGNFPTLLMANYPTIPFNNLQDNISKDGYSWTNLALSVVTRRNTRPGRALVDILIMCGGTQDIDDGDSGATVYADAVAYRDSAYAAGFDFIICTTIPDASLFSAGETTQRGLANDAFIADASNAFDGCPDISTGNFADHTSSYFSDGIHLSADDGAPAAAAIIKPFLDLIVAA